MTDIDIDAIRQREQAATEGPWETGAGEAWSDALAPWALIINANYPLIELQEGAQGVADAEFIAHARTDIPALLDLLATAEQDIRDRYEQIARLERHIAGLETQCNEQMHALTAERAAMQAVVDAAKAWALACDYRDINPRPHEDALYDAVRALAAVTA